MRAQREGQTRPGHAAEADATDHYYSRFWLGVGADVHVHVACFRSQLHAVAGQQVSLPYCRTAHPTGLNIYTADV